MRMSTGAGCYGYFFWMKTGISGFIYRNACPRDFKVKNFKYRSSGNSQQFSV